MTEGKMRVLYSAGVWRIDRIIKINAKRQKNKNLRVINQKKRLYK